MSNVEPQLPDRTGLASHCVWNAPAHGFHWINAIRVLLLTALGLILLNPGALVVYSSGKILLKSVHAWTGYVFALNIVIRMSGVSLATITPTGGRCYRSTEITSGS